MVPLVFDSDSHGASSLALHEPPLLTERSLPAGFWPPAVPEKLSEPGVTSSTGGGGVPTGLAMSDWISVAERARS